jgi:hypothetical protein
MEDVTALMNEYRECVRHLWNTNFSEDATESEPDWDLCDEFNEIAALLFRTLVLRKLGLDDVNVRPAQYSPQEPFPFLRIEVDSGSEIMVNRGEGTGYWDDPFRRVEKGELDLRFIQFFDWQNLGFREFAFYRVRIVSSKKHQHLVGRDALLPVGTTLKVFHESVAENIHH